MENNQRKPEKTRFRTKIDWIAGTFLLGLSIYAIIHSYLALPLGTHSNPGPGYMPMLLGIVLMPDARCFLERSGLVRLRRESRFIGNTGYKNDLDPYFIPAERDFRSAPASIQPAELKIRDKPKVGSASPVCMINTPAL